VRLVNGTGACCAGSADIYRRRGNVLFAQLPRIAHSFPSHFSSAPIGFLGMQVSADVIGVIIHLDTGQCIDWRRGSDDL